MQDIKKIPMVAEKLEKPMAFCDELDATSAKANTTSKPYSKSPSKRSSQAA